MAAPIPKENLKSFVESIIRELTRGLENDLRMQETKFDTFSVDELFDLGEDLNRIAATMFKIGEEKEHG